MTRTEGVKSRRLRLALEAGKRWDATRAARGQKQTEIARKGSLLAEEPARAQRFQQRESLRATVQAAEGLRGILPGQERIIGATFDLRDLPSNQEADRAGHPVARLIDPPQAGLEPQGFGTGFMVSPRLLMTNHHVFPDKESARAVAHFGYEHDAQGLHSGTKFRLDPDKFFLTDVALDFSLVAVETRSLDGLALQQFGCVRLIATTGKILVGQPVSIIQYPMGGSKQWAETENKLLYLNDEMPYMQYETDTLPGSSGSPVYNTFWEAVGLHHSGVPRMVNGRIQTRTGQDWDENTMSDDEIDWVANEGVRVSCLVEFLRAQKPDTTLRTELLNELLESTSDPLPKEAAAVRKGVSMPNESIAPAVPGAMSVVVNGTANFYMTPPAAAVAVPKPSEIPVAPVEEKALRFDPKYSARKGYDAGFLTGVTIPLPSVSKARKGEILTDSKGALLVLKYHHYSLQMNKDRRLMMWSAANVDYSDTKRPVTGRATFGADTWKPDPRILGEDQIENPEFYAPARKFDCGHIVRREDNCWGDNPELQEFANSDTFHWTNCTPQHENFNRSNLKGTWGLLENHITEQSDAVTGRKLCIFAGPVLDAKDLEHDFGGGEIKIPIKFWKVIVVLQKPKKVAAFGFVLEQASAIQKHGLEAFEVGEFATFQRSLADITTMTGVEFPQVLKDADVKKGATSPRRVDSVDDLDH